MLLVPLRGRQGPTEGETLFDGGRTKIQLQKDGLLDGVLLQKRWKNTRAERQGLKTPIMEEKNKSDKGYDLNGLTGAQMLLLHLKCLFSYSSD